MKKVLLAIDGLQPGKGFLRYALQFCRKMKTELVVLQIINPTVCREVFKTVKTGFEETQQKIENALTAATLAEAGEADMAREYLQAGRQNIEKQFQRDEATRVVRSVTQRIGEPDQEIFAYLQENPDVVLTMYDSARDSKQRGQDKINTRLQTKIPHELGIPIVVDLKKERWRKRYS